MLLLFPLLCTELSHRFASHAILTNPCKVTSSCHTNTISLSLISCDPLTVIVSLPLFLTLTLSLLFPLFHTLYLYLNLFSLLLKLIGSIGMLALLLLSEKALGGASNYAVYIKVNRFSYNVISEHVYVIGTHLHITGTCSVHHRNVLCFVRHVMS